MYGILSVAVAHDGVMSIRPLSFVKDLAIAFHHRRLTIEPTKTKQAQPMGSLSTRTAKIRTRRPALVSIVNDLLSVAVAHDGLMSIRPLSFVRDLAIAFHHRSFFEAKLDHLSDTTGSSVDIKKTYCRTATLVSNFQQEGQIGGPQDIIC